MKVFKLVIIGIALLVVNNVSGQKIKVISGNLGSLKGIEKVMPTYDYSTIRVGKFDVEEEYVAHRSEEMNEDKPGHGDNWKKEWYEMRSTQYEPKFEKLFSDYAKHISIDKESADVTMDVKTTFIEPGYNIGISRRPAYLDLTITFKKGTEELAVITIYHSPGNAIGGADFDAEVRISEAYEKAGKELGYFLTKKVK